MTEAMAVEKLIATLRAAQVKLWTEDGKLKFSAPPGVMTNQLRTELSLSKAALIAWLEQTAPVAQHKAPPIPFLERDDLVLSFGQERLWFLYEMAPESPAYNISSAIRVAGPLDHASLRQSIHGIVTRHEVLRTTISADGWKPIPVIAQAPATELPVVDLRHLDAGRRDAAIRQLVNEEAQRPFDLLHGPVLRTVLLRTNDEEHVLLITLHHVFCDGWSLGVLYRDLAAFYEAGRSGRPTRLSPLPIQYADHALWQRRRLDERELQSQLSYWKRRLQGAPSSLELPADRPRPAVQSFAGARHTFSLSRSLSESLTAVSRREGATLFMTLMAAFQTLLYRYTGQGDVVVGSPIAGRTRSEVEDLIGLFMNTLVFRAEMSGNQRFSELLAQVRQRALEAYAHQDLPFEKLVEELQPERDLSRSPLFQVMFVLQNVPSADALGFSDLRLSALDTDLPTSKFDLTLEMQETGRGLTGSLEYNTDLFDSATMKRMLGHFEVLLAGIVANPQQRLSELPLLSEPEREQLLVEWNRTEAAYPEGMCLHDQFEVQAQSTPDRVALVFGGAQLTYRELNARASQLARHLKELGVGPDVLVGICMERSLELMVGLLGIFKAGGAYVPLDPEYPQERLQVIIADARLSVLLTQDRLIDRLDHLNVPILSIDGDWLAIQRQPPSGELPRVDPDNLAYVTFTSGSTGRPKGVQIRHRAVVNFIETIRRTPGLHEDDAFVSVTTISFDISVLELFLPLLTGARLIVAAADVVRDGTQLARLATNNAATIMQGTPATWRLLLEAGWQGSEDFKILIGGQALGRELATQLLGGRTQVWNMYGPTETTIWSTVDQVHPTPEPITIGRPIANTQLYVLDRASNPLPVGIPGELYIGGDGVSRGYRERPELTAASFVPSPFEAGRRLYRTGDRARYLSDGRVEFQGRIDHQVKIRGFRIELGEIEATLERHPAIRQAVATVREDKSGTERLCAYIVPDDEIVPAALELRQFVAGKLPEYMVPSSFTTLESIPLTPNGKVDRRALPAPDHGAAEPGGAYAAPRTPHEQIVSGIWCDVLGLERIGVHDNFFHVGGHSLLATQVMSRMNSAFGTNLGLRQLFESPTVAGLATHLDAAISKGDRVHFQPLVPVEQGEARVLSFAQERLWFLDQLEPNGSAYNISSAVSLTGRLNIDALEQAFGEIVRRHEALRTTFTAVQGEPTQVIGEAGPFALRRVDVGRLGGRDQMALSKRLAGQEAARPFELSQGPLMRGTLIRLTDEEHAVLLTVHHVAWDGWSFGVLVRELSTLYQMYSQGAPSSMSDLSVQYADYAAWQRKSLDGGPLESQLAYWRSRLEGAPTSLNLRTDRPRPAVQTFRGAIEEIRLSQELSEALTQLSRRQGATPFMTLLAAFYALLYRYTGQSEILVGTPIAGRTREEVEGLIGFFANTLVMRADVYDRLRFDELVAQVRDSALGAYTYQDLPFEKLVDELNVPRDLSRTPLFQVMFVLQNVQIAELRLPELTFKSLEPEHGTAKFDLTLNLSETSRGLRGFLEYNTDLFDAETIQRIVGHFEHLLKAVVANPKEVVSQLEMLSDAEQARLLVEWNDTATEYPRDASIQAVFEAQVKQTPDAVAVVAEGEQVTYRELNRQANRLAQYLAGSGLRAEAAVGVYMERGVDLVIAQLAVLKCGAVYVPLDPEYPIRRLRFLAADARIAALLTVEAPAETFVGEDVRVLAVAASRREIARQDSENLVNRSDPDSLAYVVYTSGSTGTPKGVEVPHRGVLRLLFGGTYVTLGRDVVIPHLSSPTFDASTFEVWAPLLHGGRCVLYPERVPTPRDLAAAIRHHGINTMWLTAALFNAVVDEDAGLLAGLDQLLIGGEALSIHHVRRAIAALPTTTIINGYGPTESTTFTCCYPIPGALGADRPSVPIGRPIGNTTVYLLDPNRLPVPQGLAGELHIGGAGLARGYLGRADLTAEKFVPDAYDEEPGRRVYRTGDLARYRNDGLVEFLGRLDHQVKIRGFRIELGEIEAALAKHPDVREAVVLARESQVGGRRLVAYLTTDPRTSPSTKELRELLKSELPEYMLPAAFVVLASFPLTPNGKLDRRALPEPETMTNELAETYVGPSTPQEEILVDMWSELLGVARIGVHDNFFEHGGHSLLATQLVSRVRETFKVDLAVRTVFESPTVAGLAAAIAADRGGPGGLPLVARGSRAGAMPLSYAQQRLWLLDRMDPGNPNYNYPAGLRLSGRLNVPALNQSVDEIVARHDTLRASFSDHEGTPVQIISPSRAALFPIVDLSVLSSDAQERMIGRLAEAEAQRPFDLAEGSLLRIRLLHLGEQDNVVLATMHHIACDGWSIGIFVRELSDAYLAFSTGACSPLAELPLQYSDFAEWQRQWLQGDALEAQLDYWRRRLGGQLPVLHLPRRQDRPAVPNHQARSVLLRVSEEVTGQLRQLCRQEKTTLFMTLLAAFQALLHQHTGDEDIVVGTDMAGRRDVNLERLVGFFVNLLVLRTDLSGNPTFRQLLHRVRETALGAYAHQDVPFVKLVEELQPQRHVSNTPLFQVLFVLQNTPVQSLELPGLTFRPIKAEGGKAKFDLAVFVSETGDRLLMEWVYDTDLYSGSQINEMMQHYESLLGYVVAEPNVRLKKIAFQTHYNQGSDPMDKQVRRESKIAKLRKARQLHTEA